MPEFDVYMDAKALHAAEKHVRHMAREGKEGMGLLIGNRYSWEGEEYVCVDEFITAKNQASSASVQFAREAFPELAKKIKKRFSKKMVVGWIHSHPGYGCFLSSTDIGTQNAYFNESYHVAFVMDPTKQENERLLNRAFRVNEEGYYAVSFVVVEKM
ncbi:Mov34/MPN/PAD-1 family protein [Candidatus Micrarchaeota archaeon]|nr:Mov34/MPN/PAD-1 family protein [Candidatus Micrarchaeota archaeon]